MSTIDVNSVPAAAWAIRVYVRDHGGYFEYVVNDKDDAVHHAVTIMKDGVYRRVTKKGVFEVWAVYKVKVVGPDLDTKYPDRFVRT